MVKRTGTELDGRVELARQVLSRLAAGESLRALLDDFGMPVVELALRAAACSIVYGDPPVQPLRSRLN